MQRSCGGLMSLDIQPKDLILTPSEPSSPFSSPCSPSDPILEMKSLSEDNSRLSSVHLTLPENSVQQVKRLLTGSPSNSSLDSPISSPVSSRRLSSLSPQPFQSLSSLYPGPVLGPRDRAALLSPNSIKSLKFSIEAILSPEFGKNENSSNNNNNSKQNRSSKLTSIHRSFPSELEDGHKAKKSRCSFDISSLTGKRKHSSDSESSTTSSFSTNSKESSNQKLINGVHQSLKDNLKKEKNDEKNKAPTLWPAWVYCTRYSDRPSSGPRSRRMKKKEKKPDEKRPRTAFTAEQLARLKQEFQENRYLTEKRRQDLARELKLNESQIKIWFQNKRAKIKKANGQRNPLAMHLMAQGLYNHSTVAMRDEDDDDDDDMDDLDTGDEENESKRSKSTDISNPNKTL